MRFQGRASLTRNNKRKRCEPTWVQADRRRHHKRNFELGCWNAFRDGRNETPNVIPCFVVVDICSWDVIEA
eukprot:COSAG02_NODE_65153_length_258_cov_1.635220_1_plen_70_part_10